MSSAMQPIKPPGLRERQKEERRHRILRTMMELLSVKPLEDITNSEIADRAGLTIPTIYNLIGSQADILVSLLNEAMTDLRAYSAEQADMEPLERAEDAGRFLVKRFTARQKAYRQIIRGVNAISLGSHRPYQLSPHHIYLAMMQEAELDGALRTGISAAQVADTLFQTFAGALVTWAIEGLDKAQFARQVIAGYHTVIAAHCTGIHRDAALARLQRLQ